MKCHSKNPYPHKLSDVKKYTEISKVLSIFSAKIRNCVSPFSHDGAVLLPCRITHRN